MLFVNFLTNTNFVTICLHNRMNRGASNMIEKHDTLESIKYEILYQVAKHAYAGDLKEIEPELPYEMVPGPLPTFRCCIYR